MVMRYLLLIYGDENQGAEMSPEDLDARMKGWGEYDSWVHDKGMHLGGEALQPTASATTVRLRDGKTVTTDGPFAETKEQLGGYYLIDAQNLDEAIEAAAKMPIMGRGSVEIRPIQEFDQPS
jgi:hypothetical protein